MGVGEAAEDQQLPLLIGSSSDELNQPLKRTGTLPTAVAHIITGVIGAGVLSLAWSVAQLGWIGGPLLMIVFASVTILSTNLLSDCYRYPKSDSPTRVGSYLEAVKVYLGTLPTAVAHIITGVIGAGVLSLAWSVAQLGWIGGPLLMIVFASVTILSTNLLSDCYRYPKSDSPTRVGSYLEAVKVYLGEKSQTICAIFVQESLYGTGIAYIITAAGSVK
ncbi:hypothetical protein TB2_005654 [Malus domestica]